MRVKAAVLDLDNCISDEAWREHLFELHHENPNDRYHKYHDMCLGDHIRNFDVVQELVHSNHAIIIFTARPEIVRAKTVFWLSIYGIHPVLLKMRGHDDTRGSVALKREMLMELPEYYEVKVAIDDRQDILDMYAQEGIADTRRIFIHEPKVKHP